MKKKSNTIVFPNQSKNEQDQVSEEITKNLLRKLVRSKLSRFLIVTVGVIMVPGVIPTIIAGTFIIFLKARRNKVRETLELAPEQDLDYTREVLEEVNEN